MPKLLSLLLSSLLLFGLAHSTPTAASTTLATPTAMLAADALPDSCEPNDTARQACVLNLDQVSGPFSFQPPGDQDYYSVDLGSQPTGQQFMIAVRATEGLDLLTTISRAGDSTALAVISSPAISTTLAADLTGWLLIRVENRAAALPVTQSYSLELRRVLPPPASVTARSAAALLPDGLENNWNPQTAAPVAIGVVYDLSFACPETRPDACPGGDHDYLRAPVKAGSRYQIAAFDLAPGVDPVIELFWGDSSAPVAANDDAFAGGFASLVQWSAPAHGELIIRISPRNGGQQPVVPDTVSAVSSGQQSKSGAGGYRFAIVLQHSQLAQQILARVAAAANVTLPTSTTTASAAQSATAITTPAALTTSDAPKGPALIVAADGTPLREGPGSGAVIQLLPVEQRVTLLGQASGAWVRVQPEGGVVPGWVYGPHVRESTLQSTAPDTTDGTPDLPTPLLPAPTAAPPAQISISQLPDRAPPAAPTAVPRATLSIRVQLGLNSASTQQRPAGSNATPTPAPLLPLAGVRVQLITVFGEVLTEAVTPADGAVTLTREVSPNSALLVRVPAVGLDVPIDLDQRTLTLALSGANS